MGVRSKIGGYICKYPWRVALILTIIGVILAFLLGGTLSELIRGAMIVALAFYIMISALFLFTRNWCYRIEIDKSNDSIIFYRLFNRGTRAFGLERIKIFISAYCHIYVENSDFILHAAFIHDLVSYLPKDTVVEYKGRIGKWKEKDWEKCNRPLIPGSKY